MEETKPLQISKTNSTIQQPYTQSKKRKPSNVDLRSSSSFKIRALVRQLRPLFIQVLQTPEFRNCKAANELKIQMKLLMGSYSQMTAKMDTLGKLVSEPQPSSVESAIGKISRDGHQVQVGKAPEWIQFKQHSTLKFDEGQPRKSYIVGGSIFGWNFITFGGNNPVYYGVTKESYRNTLKTKMSGIGMSSHNSRPSEVT